MYAWEEALLDRGWKLDLSRDCPGLNISSAHVWQHPDGTWHTANEVFSMLGRGEA